MSNTPVICHLGQDRYSMRVHNMSVVVEGGKVVADPNAKFSTCFDVQKWEKNNICTYIFWDQSKYAEYNDQLQIYMANDTDPRNWTVTWLPNTDSYTIAPGPPSGNAWTAPEGGGQLYLSPLDSGNPRQRFVITKCEPQKD